MGRKEHEEADDETKGTGDSETGLDDGDQKVDEKYWSRGTWAESREGEKGWGFDAKTGN